MGRLYLIDDHRMFREALRVSLASRGHDVIGEADDPAKAIGELQRLTPDLLLLDIYLGNRSGMEALYEIQRRRLSTRVIVLTMSSHPQFVAEAARLGAMGYVLKGASMDVLHEAVNKALIGQRHFDGQVAEMLANALSMPEDKALASLSERERQVLLMVVRGHSSTQIGQALHLSPKTVDSYRSRLMSKLAVSDVPALVRLCIRCGLLHADEV